MSSKNYEENDYNLGLDHTLGDVDWSKKRKRKKDPSIAWNHTRNKNTIYVSFLKLEFVVVMYTKPCKKHVPYRM